MGDLRATRAKSLDVLIVGAGFTGLYALIKIREAGLDVALLEAGSDVGGTWHHNRYPGARCDVFSTDYSYSFDQELEREWSWTEKYAPQPEIQGYLAYVAEKYSLHSDIQLGTRVSSLRFNEDEGRWRATTDNGQAYATTFVILGTGALSKPILPDIPGIEDFKGAVFHSAQWPDGPVELATKRVGLIGTGSSGIQLTPMLAEDAEHLHVFQRTANFSVPSRNRPRTEEQIQDWKLNFKQYRQIAYRSAAGHTDPLNDIAGETLPEEVREEELERRWRMGGLSMLRAFNDVMRSREVNEHVCDFIRGKIRETVNDSETAAALQPNDHLFGTKRPCSGTNYYETFNRDNVTLNNLRKDPIQRVLPSGIELASGAVDLDVMVLATGFDSMTGAILNIDIEGRNGTSIASAWSGEPKNYLGMTIHGFPNLYYTAGPGGPSVLSNMVFSIERQVEWISRCITDLGAARRTRIEATPDAQDRWSAGIQDLTKNTLYAEGKNTSWYMGANVPGKPRYFTIYIGGMPRYMDSLAEVRGSDYAGFELA